MILCSYLNNIEQFESLCKKMRGNSSASFPKIINDDQAGQGGKR